MPNGIFPVPEFHPTPSRSAPSLAVRVWTRLRRNRLDQELALGADPGGSASLGHRAAQLRSRGERARLANALVETLGDARRGSRSRSGSGRSAPWCATLPMTCWGLCCGSETTGRSTSAAQR